MDDTAANAAPSASQISSFANARELLTIIANPERHATLVAELLARIASAEEGIAAIDSEREPFDADIRDQTAALTLEGDALVERHVAVIAKQKTIQPRRNRIAELCAAWRNHMEPDLVCRDLQSPLGGSPLFKARKAYGKISRTARGRRPARRLQSLAAGSLGAANDGCA